MAESGFKPWRFDTIAHVSDPYIHALSSRGEPVKSGTLEGKLMGSDPFLLNIGEQRPQDLPHWTQTKRS